MFMNDKNPPFLSTEGLYAIMLFMLQGICIGRGKKPSLLLLLTVTWHPLL